MTSKLPWATAAVIIVVAAIGAWVLWPAAPPTPPAAGGWTSIVWGYAPENTGIENVYFMDWDNKYDNTDNILGTPPHENIILGKTNTPVIFRNPAMYAQVFTDNLNYNDRFYIIAKAVIYSGDAANAQRENIILKLNSIGDIVIPTDDENRTGDTGLNCLWLAGTSTEGTFPLTVNGVWDNEGYGYELPVGGSATFTITLYTWK